MGGLLMIVIGVSYGGVVEKFGVCGGGFGFSFLSFGSYVRFFC